MSGSKKPVLRLSPVETDIEDGTLARTESAKPAPHAGTRTKKETPCAELGTLDEKLHENLLLLAAVVYGEASSKNVEKEMFAIASVIVRQKNARGVTLGKLLGSNSTFAFAASDGNRRVARFRAKSLAEKRKNKGMCMALRAAKNAIHGGTDHSNSAYFWDGKDIKTNYDKHPKVKLGIKITDEAHNIYKIKNKSVPKTEHWIGTDGKPGKVRGKYEYTYESTAGHGGTIFWKYTAEFLEASGNKVYK